MDVLRSKARSKLSRSKNAIHSTLSSHEKRDVLVLEPSSSGKAEAVCQWIVCALAPRMLRVIRPDSRLGHSFTGYG